MKATIENLKANRDIIIESLIELFGTDKLTSKMNILKNHVEFAEEFEARDIEDIIDEMSMDIPSRRKVSKTANMLAEMAERRGEVWSSKEQKFVKF